jgi:hypothetical protein
MAETTLTVPATWNVNNIHEFVRKLWNLETYDQIILDFRHTSWCPPYGMLFLARQIRRFRNSRPETRFRAINFDDGSYLAHMGFFQAMGLQHGKAPGEALGSATYLPISRLDASELDKEAAQMGEPIGAAIENKADELSRILTREDSRELVETLKFSIREIVRNSIEHSNEGDVWYCAQYWPTKYRVEVAILDEGRGIKEALSSNPYLEIKDD